MTEQIYTDEERAFAVAEIMDKIREDDAAHGIRPAPAPIEDMLSIGYMIAKEPYQGGEFYRALRPAMLSSRDFGWETALCMNIGVADGSTKVGGISYGGGSHVIEPDVWIVRPIGRQIEGYESFSSLVDEMHAAGQVVIADLDDDIWAHEDWTDDTRPTGDQDDYYEEWCWKVDGWLVSTPYMKERVEAIAARRGVAKPRVLVAPNCYDPIGIGKDSHPIGGRRLGTRLWLSGRMLPDLDIYRECFGPLLNELDLTFTHIGREHGIEEGPGQHARNFIDDCGFPAKRVLELPSTTIPQLGAILGQTISIAAIAIADHPFNRAKTETHAVEVASAGLPMVAATSLEIYADVPGRVYPNPKAVSDRVKHLLDLEVWKWESDKARTWARRVSVRSERAHLVALQTLVKELTD